MGRQRGRDRRRPAPEGEVYAHAVVAVGEREDVLVSELVEAQVRAEEEDGLLRGARRPATTRALSGLEGEE